MGQWRCEYISQQGDLPELRLGSSRTSEFVQGFKDYLDISPEAARLLGERKGPDELVFSDFLYDIYMRHELRAWCLRAGIPKSPTFHSARHTFAVMMLDLGADIYTVQKLLGHRELRTTEIYAKILDRKKQEAVLKIPNIGI